MLLSAKTDSYAVSEQEIRENFSLHARKSVLAEWLENWDACDVWTIAHEKFASAISWILWEESECDLCKAWIKRMDSEDFSKICSMAGFVAHSSHEYHDRAIPENFYVKFGDVSWHVAPPDSEAAAETFELKMTIDCDSRRTSKIAAELWQGKTGCRLSYHEYDLEKNDVFWCSVGNSRTVLKSTKGVEIFKKIPILPEEKSPSRADIERFQRSGEIFAVFAASVIQAMSRKETIYGETKPNFEYEKAVSSAAVRGKRAGEHTPLTRLYAPDWEEWQRNLDKPPIFKPEIEKPNRWFSRFKDIRKLVDSETEKMRKCLNFQLADIPNAVLFDDDLITLWAVCQHKRWIVYANGGDHSYGSWHATKFSPFHKYPKELPDKLLRSIAERWIENLASLLAKTVRDERDLRLRTASRSL